MSDRDSLSAEKAKAFQEGWRAHKNFADALRSKAVTLPNPPKPLAKNFGILKKHDCLTLTRKDYAFLYDIGVSCE